MMEAAVDRLCERSLYHFTTEAWAIVEPQAFVDGWHIRAICDHLQAVTEGRIVKLLINIPPRCSKSLLVAAFWPVWEWIVNPTTKFFFTSYDQGLSLRDSVRCRRLIDSEWFQSRWGDRFYLTSDQNEKKRFDNDKRGFRFSSSVEGMATGEGADRIVVDDAHNVSKAESETERKKVVDWYSQAMSTRGNRGRMTSRVVVGQRVHQWDVSQWCIEQGDYVHLCLPMEFDPAKACSTSLGWSDPRTELDELICPHRFSREDVDDLKKTLGPYGTACQLQQNPKPRSGGVFPEAKVNKVTRDMVPRRLDSVVRYWDKASTPDAGDFSAGVLIGRALDKFWVLDVKRGQWDASTRNAIMAQAAAADKAAYEYTTEHWETWTEQEPGSGGKESAQSTIIQLAGYPIRADKVTGDKYVRAQPFAAQWQAGNVNVVTDHWTQAYIDELAYFPNGRYDDQVDGSSGGFNKLALAGLPFAVA